jgi:hypothetical protein
MVDSFDLTNIPNTITIPASRIGWPILPHGHGAFYNVFGGSINIPTGSNPGPETAAGWSYASYLPGNPGSSGRIIACSINYCHKNLNGPTSGFFNVLVINYSTGQFENVITISATALATANSTQLVLNPAIRIFEGDYIGICVTDPTNNSGNPPPQIAIEGTIHFTLDLN